VRVAALYDIHGNLPALEAVLADRRLAGADLVLVGGDVVAGPQPREVLERLLALGERARFVRGNGDRWVTGAGEPDLPPQLAAEVAWCAEQLSAGQRAGVRAWPATATERVDGLGDVLFCHATPRSDMELVTPATSDDDVAAALGDTAAAAVVCGHIHVQYERAVSGTRLVNAGSVGRPNERPAAAYWALLGGTAPIELVRTDYDVERAVAAIAESGYPSPDLAQALREPPAAEETIAFFESRRGA
jgi:predicted phosphodiesterase